MTLFVLHQHREHGRTYENNVRMGGFSSESAANKAAVRHAPAIIRDQHRNIVGQTVSAAAPRYVEASYRG